MEPTTCLPSNRGLIVISVVIGIGFFGPIIYRLINPDSSREWLLAPMAIGFLVVVVGVTTLLSVLFLGKDADAEDEAWLAEVSRTEEKDSKEPLSKDEACRRINERLSAGFRKRPTEGLLTS